MSWTSQYTGGTLDASINLLKSCPQEASALTYSSVDEDCLYLNIFTPSDDVLAQAGGLVPVLIFIHGWPFKRRTLIGVRWWVHIGNWCFNSVQSL